jgi:hypothetical protein
MVARNGYNAMTHVCEVVRYRIAQDVPAILFLSYGGQYCFSAATFLTKGDPFKCSRSARVLRAPLAMGLPASGV